MRTTYVFDQEDGPPANLRTKVLHGHVRAVGDTSILQLGLVRQVLVVSLEGELLTRCVELHQGQWIRAREPRQAYLRILSCNSLLHVEDRGIFIWLVPSNKSRKVTGDWSLLDR